MFAISGYKQGFVRALISLIGAVFSLWAAVYFSSIISNYIYVNFMQPDLLKKVNDILLSNPQEIREKFNSLPKIILNGFESYGITFEKINHIIINDKINAAGLIVDLFSPIMINFIKVIIIACLVYLHGKNMLQYRAKLIYCSPMLSFNFSSDIYNLKVLNQISILLFPF